ncbi:MAG: DUF4350 domain-containing protein [Austwickia sp.]|nr:DUF4350 domain-containing protein [Actinomycetota bacterium]MCB1252134.1 DUF4350 domain-containing protein [Austwickia sp.]MCO5309840.1 DUF4350 domain-containing protein [Austwickia sp.]
MRTAARPAGVVGLVLGIVLAALLSTYWLGGGTVGTGAGDPDSADPGGARAVTTILRERGGVDVRTARGLDDIGDVTGRTLVVGTSRKLSGATLDRLRESAQPAATLVLIRPHPDTLEALAPLVTEAGRTSGVLRANCGLGDLQTDLEISGAAQLYRVRSSAARPGGSCFTQVGGGSALPGAVAWTTAPGRRTFVIGNRDMVTNASLLEVDNATVALRLLGHDGGLTWYTGAAADIAPAAPGQPRLWPPAWLGPLTLALAGIVVALMLWRGRRLGRLAVEPLPVIVQAGETTLARGRLYRRGQDPGHAAQVLQNAVRGRLAAALAIPPGADPGQLVQAAARATGRDPAAIHDLLTRSPAGDAELVTLTGELARLDREVRRA